MNQEGYEQAKADLVEMFRCPGWQTAKTLLRQRLRAIEWQVTTDFRLVEGEIRLAQREHQLIRALLESPMEWFLDGVKVVSEREEEL